MAWVLAPQEAQEGLFESARLMADGGDWKGFIEVLGVEGMMRFARLTTSYVYRTLRVTCSW